jgi:large subunit ribosomal protein L30
MNKNLKIQLIKSFSRMKEDHCKTIKGLGLKRIGQIVIRENTPSIRGMVKKVIQYVKTEEFV